jgi:hypothetical protein
MEWVTSTVHTTSEHGVSSITTADAHTSAELMPPADLNGFVSVSPKDEILFLRVCHHISNAVYHSESSPVCFGGSFPRAKRGHGIAAVKDRYKETEFHSHVGFVA